MLFAKLQTIDISFPRLVMIAGGGTVAVIVLSTLFMMATNRRVATGKRRSLLIRAMYFAFIASVGVLGVSSFGSILWFGHMPGYALLAHLAAGGSFVFLLLAIAVLYLPHGAKSNSSFGTTEQRWWVARWSATLLVFSGLITAGTMFLSMLPILDTEGLIKVAALHGYSGLVVVVIAIFHAYAILCTRVGWR